MDLQLSRDAQGLLGSGLDNDKLIVGSKLKPGMVQGEGKGKRGQGYRRA